MLQRLKKNSGMVSALKEAHDGMLPKNAITSDYDCLVLDWKLKDNYHKYRAEQRDAENADADEAPVFSPPSNKLSKQ